MRRVIFIVICLGLLGNIGFAQSGLYGNDSDRDEQEEKKGLKKPKIDNTPFTEIKFGRMNPEDTGSGNLFGVAFGRRLDNRLNYGFEINYFKASYRQETIVAIDTLGNNTTFATRELELEFNTVIIPILFKIDFRSSLRANDDEENGPLFFRLGGGLGWGLIWNEENNFQEDIERNRFFNGLIWQFSGGIEYKISDFGSLFIETFYNDGDASRNGERNQNGLPIWQTMEISGFGGRIGLRLAHFGF